MSQKPLKIALVHDYLKDYGGAESVLETLSDIFPDAQIFTAVYAPKYLGPHCARLEKKWHGRIHQSFFGFFPLAAKLLSPLRFLSPLAFKSFDFSGYDLIISSATGAFFPNSLNKKSAKLICYCHTPPRYLYGLVTARSLDTWFYKLINIPLQITLHFYRLLDFKYAQNVDQFIANSATTAARIQKFYRRNSVVVNPPVEIPNASSPLVKEGGRGDFYLTGGRLARAKRYDIAVAACNQLKANLKVFGRDFAGFETELKKVAGPSVEFLGEVTQEQKFDLLSRAEAFIFCSDNEDFGIAPVEAMAVGTPVVAYRSGGTTETVIDGKTGIFFDKLTPDSCAKAIQKLSKTKISPAVCIARAQDFSKEKFISKIKKLVSTL
jgi:glycosyltransferase involved in cell wall biosynthesis